MFSIGIPAEDTAERGLAGRKNTFRKGQLEPQLKWYQEVGKPKMSNKNQNRYVFEVANFAGYGNWAYDAVQHFPGPFLGFTRVTFRDC
jgi:hypothetical protein